MNRKVPKLEIITMLCWVGIEITVMSVIDRRQRQQVKSLKSLTAWQEKASQDNTQENLGLSGGEQKEHGQCAKDKNGLKSITTLAMIPL
jgi:hypothetical protein